MKTLLFLILGLEFSVFLSLLLSLFAGIISIGYFLTPRLRFGIFLNQGKFKVKVVNRNFSKVSIKDLQCELILSVDNHFHDTIRTLKLRKGNILFLRSGNNNYTYWAIENANLFQDYAYIKVKLSCINSLGVRKIYEQKAIIENLPLECILKKREKKWVICQYFCDEDD